MVRRRRRRAFCSRRFNVTFIVQPHGYSEGEFWEARRTCAARDTHTHTRSHAYIRQPGAKWHCWDMRSTNTTTTTTPKPPTPPTSAHDAHTHTHSVGHLNVLLLCKFRATNRALVWSWRWGLYHVVHSFTSCSLSRSFPHTPS